ncbi:MAG: hypothetical protein ACKOCX_06100 [Planctomycetota bacterium]
MRTLVILGLIVGGLVVAGAIHISQTDGTIEVTIDEQKVEDVAVRVATEGRQLLRQAAAEPGTQTR